MSFEEVNSGELIGELDGDLNFSDYESKAHAFRIDQDFEQAEEDEDQQFFKNLRGFSAKKLTQMYSKIYSRLGSQLLRNQVEIAKGDPECC